MKQSLLFRIRNVSMVTQGQFKAETAARSTLSVMHQSFVTTAPPPAWKGGDNDFSVSVPCYKTHPQGANWRSKLCSLPRPSNSKSPWGKDPNVKTPPFWTLEKKWPCTFARLSPTLSCVGGGGGGVQWIQMFGALTKSLNPT